MSEEEVKATIASYLEGLGLLDYVEIKLEANCLSRATIGFFKEKAVLKLRTPL